MRNLLPIIDRWRGQAKQVAVATLIQIYGSAPQPLGARMVISSAGEMAGSVSGGCVEGAVVHEALEVLAAGRPRLVEYGIADELAQSVGLACGGQIGVYIEPWPAVDPAVDPAGDPVGDPVGDRVVAEYERALRNARLVALVLAVRGPLSGGRLLVWPGNKLQGTLGNPDLDQLAADRAQPLLAQQQSELLPFNIEGPAGAASQAGAVSQAEAVFIDVQPPPPRLIIVGAVHIAIPLITYAKVLGFHTIVLDARSAFATPERFQHADRLQIGWPADALPELEVDEGTYVVVLTHDEKIDDPALVYACRSRARYIGALGSRRTHAKRCERLAELGLTEDELARIHAPIGISIGARTPEEIAISIAAELVTARNGH